MQTILTGLLKNETAIVKKVEGGAGVKQQLSLRGLCEGVKIRMIDCTCGPVVLDINGSTLALGRGIAGKIIVDRC
ncbi:ferrous iron transport protein A [Methanomicrobium antiquum]|uniref:Ferrous iron transport protein A n=1 Tax=Methanomicrobium antiquum TaxID=487686 RepID=A0AAF0FQC6_9EURY|nr:FeoA family protein [Methanomicrobium antiquum]MDD3977652.1 FeoA family protein [Methanomicrobium sp.]WFN36617.1 ferrous iron transport protein A [Methanomicrobium antiquum]